MLCPVVRRTAFYAAIRARSLSKTVGLMITASHNPISDNGIKLVDPDGRMLPLECEIELTNIVNATEDEFERIKKEMMAKTVVASDGRRAAVFVGTDTRPSSPALLGTAVDEIGRVNGVHVEQYENYTTPQLHFIVRSVNRDDPQTSPCSFLSHFRNAFATSLELVPLSNCSRYSKQLFVDCANGVGALWVDKYFDAIADGTPFSAPSNGLSAAASTDSVQLRALNTDTESLLLNHECGADFVKINSKIPANFDSVPLNSRCASLDGDADRLIYFYPSAANANGGGGVVLLDGDHIAALFATFIAQQFSVAEKLGHKIPLSFGVVQTAYANGNSTRFFTEKLGIEPVITKTGVKYLEEAALNFDIGLYFEANGHGTVCFSDRFYAFLEEFSGNEVIPRHIQLLSMFSQLVNEDWLAETYADIPNVQKKVEVKDRSIFETAADRETVLIRPEGMQAKIDSIISEFDKARAFIRPSGTEPIVRIYAEAETTEKVNEIAEKLAELVLPF
ncbi:hypothetical protein niasHS_011059 [Heterodera schachtii]|uniref:Phosphoacetylglucosamine mutase n=1 Tax=Heterodera schachtii TaxID=97005 RepID=A0ABD2ITD9_HETSC